MLENQQKSSLDSNIYDVINGITGMFYNSSLDDLQNQINAEEEELRQQELQKDKLENLEQELKHSIHDELVLDTDNKPNTVRDKILSFFININHINGCINI